MQTDVMWWGNVKEVQLEIPGSTLVLTIRGRKVMDAYTTTRGQLFKEWCMFYQKRDGGVSLETLREAEKLAALNMHPDYSILYRFPK